MRAPKVWALALLLSLGISPGQAQTPPAVRVECPKPALSRLQKHRVKKGQTLATIAAQYQLVPQSVVNFNPQLKTQAPRPGQTLLIPPFNGQRASVPPGGTWQDLAQQYGIRADLLFEINGCQRQPKEVFIPGIASAPKTPKAANYTGLTQFPLEAAPQLLLDYGWQKDAAGQAFFHSGVDLAAPVGTPVLAAADGVVILVSQEGPYGSLVVIDHGNGWQTRYAHLGRFGVPVDQPVRAGTVIGYVGQTGRPDMTPPHLHFEVRFQSPAGWMAQDPKLHLPR